MYRSAIACCHLDMSEAVESEENFQKRINIKKLSDNRYTEYMPFNQQVTIYIGNALDLSI